jgi:replicative DNA helicase
MAAMDVDTGAPARLDATEAALLGVVLRDPATVATVARSVPTPMMFDAPANRAIWTAVAACGAHGGVERVLETMRRIDPAGVDSGVMARVRWLAANAPSAPLAGVVRAFERAYVARNTARVGAARDLVPPVGGARAPAPRERPAAVPATAPWDEPLPLDPADVPPPFPPDVLPGALGAFARALATATQTPLDLPGMLALAAVSAASGRRFVVRTNYREPVNVFAAVALPPGSRKSEVVREIVWPFDEWERRAAEELARQPVTDPPAPKPRLYSTDATPESLATRLAEQGGRFALLSPEGGGVFAMMCGRYGDAPNIEVYLHGHAGDKIVVDRVKRASETIWAPALTIGVAAQPDSIRALVGQSDLAARGLLARFLFALPASNIGFRRVDAPPMPRDVRAQYARTVRALLDVPEDRDERGRTRPWNLALDGAATQLDFSFRARCEARQRPDGDLAAMPEWASKFAGSTLRIAALLHLATHAADETPWRIPISAETLERAIYLAEDYLVPHARLAFGAMTEGTALRLARRLLEWLRRNRAQKLTPREAMRALGGRGKRTEVADPALEVLTDHGWIRPLEVEPTGRVGRPRADLFAVHPLVLGVCHQPSATVSNGSRQPTTRNDS